MTVENSTLSNSHVKLLSKKFYQTLMNNIKLKLIVFVFLILSVNCYSQQQQEWVRQFNSGLNQNDNVTDMKIDDEGNIYLCGSVQFTSSIKDLLLLKYSSSGELLWSRTWRGTGVSLNDNVGKKILFDSKGFIYVMGTASISATYLDFLVIKYNPNGDTVWIRTFDGMNDNVDDATDMVIDKNDNVYLTGLLSRFGTSDNGTIKYDENGNLKWKKKFSDFSGRSILLDSGFLYVGGASNYDISILKYDTIGNLIDTFYCGTENSDGAQLMVFDSQKNLIVSGIENAGLPTQYNIVTAKISQTGVKSWISVFNNNFDNRPEYLYDLETDSAGNALILVRSRNQQYNRSEICLIKYDNKNGDSIWTRKYNLAPFSNEQPVKMTQDKDNNIYIIETSDSNVIFYRIVIIKYNSSGQLQWHKVYYPALFSNSYGACISADTLGNIYAAGITNYDQTGGDDIVLIKYSTMTNVSETSTALPGKFELYQNYPNPFNSQTEIKFDLIKSGHYKIEVFDMLGRSVAILFNEFKNAGSYNLNYDASNLSSGIYFYKLNSPELNIIKKFILVK